MTWPSIHCFGPAGEGKTDPTDDPPVSLVGGSDDGPAIQPGRALRLLLKFGKIIAESSPMDDMADKERKDAQ